MLYFLLFLGWLAIGMAFTLLFDSYHDKEERILQSPTTVGDLLNFVGVSLFGPFILLIGSISLFIKHKDTIVWKGNVEKKWKFKGMGETYDITGVTWVYVYENEKGKIKVSKNKIKDLHNE